jgi:hypothetical protein
MGSLRYLLFSASVLIAAAPLSIFSAENDDADERLFKEIMKSGTSFFKNAEKETEFPDAEIVVALLRQRRFDDLTAQLCAYKKAPNTPDGNLPLFRFLEKPPFSFDDVIYLDEWCKNSSASPYPFLVRGAFYSQAAWNARGSGFSSTVSDEQRNKFRELLKIAGADFKKALKIDPSNGLACAYLVYWAGCGGSDVKEAEYYFHKGAQILKGNPGLYYYMFWVYTPQWHGDEKTSLDFALKSAAQFPGELGYLVGTAHDQIALRQTGYNGINKAYFDYFRTPGVWEQIFEAFKPVIKKHPQSKRRRVQLFKFAVYAGRMDELWSWLRKELLE